MFSLYTKACLASTETRPVDPGRSGRKGAKIRLHWYPGVDHQDTSIVSCTVKHNFCAVLLKLELLKLFVLSACSFSPWFSTFALSTALWVAVGLVMLLCSSS